MASQRHADSNGILIGRDRLTLLPRAFTIPFTLPAAASHPFLLSSLGAGSAHNQIPPGLTGLSSPFPGSAVSAF